VTLFDICKTVAITGTLSYIYTRLQVIVYALLYYFYL